MIRRQIPGLLAVALLAACTQDEQKLPFSVGANQSVSKTISTGGGTLSTPSGASLTFPSGSLAASTAVTITPTAPSAAASAIGSPVAAMSMAVTPSGTQLAQPAQFHMSISPDAGAETQNAWLTTILLEHAGTMMVFPKADLDLTNKIIRTDITRLGTLTPIIPPASAIINIPGALSASRALGSVTVADAGALAGVKTISKTCGGFNGTTYAPCPGLTATATQNVIDRYPEIAIVFPSISGSLTLAADPAIVSAVVTGSLNSFTTFRVQSGGGTGATSVEFTVVMAATAASRATQVGNTLTITNLQVTTTQEDGTTSTITKSVVFQVSGSTATATETRDVDLGDGTLGSLTVSLAFDITTY